MKNNLQWSPNEDITLFCAFRYALGRQTYVVGAVADEILRNWDRIPTNTKLRISKEILEEWNVLSSIDKPIWGAIVNRVQEENQNEAETI